ncbi:unnamed protein product, partial [marine sediment metagenome]
MTKCLNCEKELLDRQKKYCSISCQSKNWRKNNPDYTKRYNMIERTRKWRKRNPELHRKQGERYNQSIKGKETKREYKLKYPNKVKKDKRMDQINNKQHYQIRYQTRKKYGKLLDGMVYHHITEPYHIDIWDGC